MAEPDIRRSLTGGAEEDLWGRGVTVFLQEMVLDLPSVVVAQFVS